MENESSFAIRGLEQIFNHLVLLQKSKCLLSVICKENNTTFLTTIIDIDKKNKTLILDYGPKEYLNRPIINGQKTNFVSEYNGIKVAFNSSNFKKIEYDNHPAFQMPLPDSILWMQRREFYRVRSPISKISFCHFTLPEQEPINLQLYDISISGFSVLVESKEVCEFLELNTPIEDSKLVLEGVGEGVIAFEVRSKYVMNPEKLNKIEKIGCMYTHITPSFQTMIQQYMQQIERENKLRD
jgi:c-di-GMP-binding flagellar brake protein YcgR